MKERESGSIQEKEAEIKKIRLQGRVLYLTRDPLLIRKQLDGEDLAEIPQKEALLSGISTDEIAPNRICLQFTGKEDGLLGEHALIGLRGGIIEPGELVNGGFEALVAGPSFARGSSRIHAPVALSEAGIKYIVAEPEAIFEENCTNLALHILDPENKTVKKFLQKEEVDFQDLITLEGVSGEIVKHGGLLKYLRAIDEGKSSIPEYQTPPRGMTMAEKIIAQHALSSNGTKVEYVKPGQEHLVTPDRYYGYELQTGVVRKALKDEFGDSVPIKNPHKITLHNDHTALLQNNPPSRVQREEQSIFANSYGIQVYEADPQSGSPGICHTIMLEEHALPGELIIGNDSHTCTLGVENNVAIGAGAIDLAGAMAYDQAVVKVPETIRFELKNMLQTGVTTKDLMIFLGSLSELKEQRIGSGKVFEFGGDGLSSLSFDQQLKLTNMAIELQARTGIVEMNEKIIEYLMEKRGFSKETLLERAISPDSDAEYFRTFSIDLDTIEPMISEPGDTQNGKPLSEIERKNIEITKAYIGSCTHGTPEDLRQAAEVLNGKKIHPSVQLFVQASSLTNQKESQESLQILLEAGATLLPIGCGACMNAGPGSTEEGETAIFATNRNFPGRTGKGETYLSNPAVVAASAIKGQICSPKSLE